MYTSPVLANLATFRHSSIARKEVGFDVRDQKSRVPRLLSRGYAAGKMRDLSTIRASGAAALSREDVLNVRWAGIFGSLAIEKQTESSDVDAVVVHESDYPNAYIPPEVLELEDILPQIWGRKVDIHHITLKGDLRGYMSVESLLCSRTFYGSDQDPAIMQLRHSARSILHEGDVYLNLVLDDIQKTNKIISGLSKEEFCSNPKVRETVLDRITMILDKINIQPTWHPIHCASYYVLIQPSEGIRRKMNEVRGTQEGSVGGQNTAFWRVVWEIATGTQMDSLYKLARRIEQFVLPTIYYTREKSALVEKLECGDK